MHFLPIDNLVGVLATSKLMCRKMLPECDRIRYVREPNTSVRWDRDWTDHVNLSIERINGDFLAASRAKKRSDAAWCILGFDPVILAHPGVIFVTTNNVYPSAVREKGVDGFMRLFAPTVKGKNSRAVHRPEDVIDAWPTDHQAEVLYPRFVDCTHLRQITVECEVDSDTIAGMRGVLDSGSNTVPVVKCEPEMFR